MYRDGHYKPKEKLNLIFNCNGLGDNIAYMTAIKYIRDTFKNVEINLFVPDYFIDLAYNLVPNINIKKFSEGHTAWDSKVPYRGTKNESHTTLRTHLVDHAFHVLCDRQVDISQKNYCKLNLEKIDISKFNLPEKYCVVTTGFTAEVREMLPEVVNGITKYILSKGYIPVFLGNKQAKAGDLVADIKGNFKEEIDYSVGINLIDQTNLLEAGKIISSAKCIIGLDNGLLHLAGTTDTPIVAGYTTVAPELRLPIRDNILGKNCYTVVPEKTLKCRFCQSNWDFTKQDFKYCYYKDYQCTKMLTADKYIQHLEKIL